MFLVFPQTLMSVRCSITGWQVVCVCMLVLTPRVAIAVHAQLATTWAEMAEAAEVSHPKLATIFFLYVKAESKQAKSRCLPCIHTFSPDPAYRHRWVRHKAEQLHPWSAVYQHVWRFSVHKGGVSTQPKCDLRQNLTHVSILIAYDDLCRCLVICSQIISTGQSGASQAYSSQIHLESNPTKIAVNSKLRSFISGLHLKL